MPPTQIFGHTVASQPDVGGAACKASLWARASQPTWLIPSAFAALFFADAVRLFRHAFWEDELQAWVIARVSATPLALFHNLRYEGHPGLWHLLLWVLTRFTADPAAMHVLQVAIAGGTWFIVYRYAPFSRAEKFLLLLSYFLFWEYFVLSRSYGLMALLGLAFIAVRARRPESMVLPWVLLALLANTVVFGAIWSIALAMSLGLAQIAAARSLPRTALVGGFIYIAGLALAVATMMPAPDGNFRTPVYAFDIARVVLFAEHLVSGAFVPLNGILLSHPLSAFSGNADNYWNPQFGFLASVAGIAIVLAIGIVVAAIACSVMVRKRRIDVIEPIAAAIATFVGSIVFSDIWLPTSSRHAGVLFLALAGSLWLLRARRGGSAPRWWIALLAVNALGGLVTLQSELRPFSEAAAATRWLTQNGLEHAFIMSAGAQQVEIVGYLDRPIYDLGCECSFDFIRWNDKWEGNLKDETLTPRIARGLESAPGSNHILVLDHPFVPGADARFGIRLLHAFRDAAVSVDNFYIYRVSLNEASSSRPSASNGNAAARSRS